MINRRKRRDANHQAIVEAFRAAGWALVDMSQLGDAVADLMVAKAGRVIAVEVKGPKTKVTPGQASWLSDWPGETAIIRSVSDVLELSRG